jgi:DNA gyrase subunit A
LAIDKDKLAETTVLVVAEKGYGKRSFLVDPETGEDEYRVTGRGGKGVKTLNITDKTGDLISISNVTDEDGLMIINKSGLTIRMRVDSMRTMGRATQGVKLINIKNNDSIASVAVVPVEEEEEIVEGAENAIDGETALESDSESNANENLDSDNPIDTDDDNGTTIE